MNTTLIIVIAVSEAISIPLAIKLWRGKDHTVIKYIRIVLTLFPILGPVFYLFTTNPPPVQPISQQDKPSDINHNDFGHIPNFDRYWQARKPFLEQEIKRLKEKIQKSEGS